ncbi:MarR family winged helix-turn-helix transcriptional regulator [Holzapfeliella floricola]|uniref:MarR family winged helix-turn-helix transcriptional regulator n=1 Tax=Holzapfeliella floricola TaxID=679249 RepID=UPI000781C93F|nr:MarR family transcriptional regulator [Holzapfeliella floricola]
MTIKNIRHFNRFYTQILGVFNNHVFDLKYSLLEMRVLGEIGRNQGIISNNLLPILSIDKTYLSRILRKLKQDDLIERKQDEQDLRIYHLYLTDKGQDLNNHIEEQSDNQVADNLKVLSSSEINELEQSMATIEKNF